MLSLCTTVISVMIFEYSLWSTFSMSQQKKVLSAYSCVLKMLTLLNRGVHSNSILLFYTSNHSNEYTACLCQKHSKDILIFYSGMLLI